MRKIEENWFNNQTSCVRDESTLASSGLPLESFQGLFDITGIVSSACLFLFLANFFYMNRGGPRAANADGPVWRRVGSLVAAWMRRFDMRDPSSRTFRNHLPPEEELEASNQPDVQIQVPQGDDGLPEAPSSRDLGSSRETEMTSSELPRE